MPLFWFTYDFGYSWPFTLGHLFVGSTATALAIVCAWRRWHAWAIGFGLMAVWGFAGAVSMHHAVQINEPQRLVTNGFLPSGLGRVLDLGAGSGRASVGVLLARPQATVTAVDLYRGYYGIDDNTPHRLRLNATKAGVADRVQIEVADMRTLPFPANSFDAAISVAAIDHLRWDGVEQALSEAARVLRPAGQLLIVSLNVDGWVRVAMPWSLHGHGYWGRSPDREAWRAALERCGFELTEVGTRPATVYFLATKRHARSE